MSLRADTPARPAARIRRFSRAERWVHRTTAALMGVCVATAAVLYIPQLAVLVGRRALVVRVHECAGLALPVPVLLGLASRAFRPDLRFLNRFGPHDRVWLRAALRRDRRRQVRPAGKFNAGQKIYAAWIAGATLVMLGTGLLWFGWFGFNVGSALGAGSLAGLAMINTFTATAGGILGWVVIEALLRGKASMLGAASGAVAGLVAVTPAAGNVGIGGALIIGLVGGFACLWGVHGLKKMLGADDSLDVFGVHGVGGIVGALLTGVFNSPALGGPGYVADWVTASMVTAADYSIAAQVWTQAKAVLLTVVWSGVVSVIAFKLVDLMVGLRVSEEDEREGLDITSHGETAYSR